MLPLLTFREHKLLVAECLLEMDSSGAEGIVQRGKINLKPCTDCLRRLVNYYVASMVMLIEKSCLIYTSGWQRRNFPFSTMVVKKQIYCCFYTYDVRSHSQLNTLLLFVPLTISFLKAFICYKTANLRKLSIQNL